MKYTIKATLTFLLLMAFLDTATAALAPFTITGSIKGLPEGTKLNLVPGATHTDEKPVATATVLKGQFIFNSKVDGIRLFSIQVEGTPGATSLMVEPAKINFQAVATLTGNSQNKYYEFTDVVVKGSAAHLLYLKKVAPKYMLDSLYNANHEAGKALMDQMNKAYQAKDTVLVKQLKETTAWKKINQDESAFFKLAEQSLAKIVSDNKDSWWGPFLALELYSYYTPKDKPMYAAFPKQAKDSHYGKILGELINPVGFTGRSAPLLDLKSNGNLAKNLAALTKGHQYVLVDFWASWCVPCRKSIPHLKKTYADLKDKGLQIVSISIDKKEADWTKAQKEEQLPWPSFLDNGGTSAAWKIQAIPAMFLLDEKGVVIAENLSLEEMVAKMKL
jgi:thiol-disulfide isomerase/thioredoxin